MTSQKENSRAIPAQGHLGYWIGSLSSAVRKGLSEELESFGVTPSQWVILEAAFDGNANTLTGLAGIIPIDAAAISRQLDKLTDKGLVRRRRLRSDRRTVRIELTKTGRELVPKLVPRVQANNAKFLTGISREEQSALMDVVQRMLRNAEPWIYSDEQFDNKKEDTDEVK